MIVTTDASCCGLAEQYPPATEVHLRYPPGGAANHAAALEAARRTISLVAPPPDIVLCLDDDVVILSPEFGATLRDAFTAEVGAWGATGIRDPLHPSCLAMRRDLFAQMTTFHATLPMHDTSGRAQAEIVSWGYSLYPVAGVRLYPEGWDAFGVDRTNGGYLWAHLGGGVIHSRVPWWRRAGRHVKAALGHDASRDLIVKARMRERWVEKYA